MIMGFKIPKWLTPIELLKSVPLALSATLPIGKVFSGISSLISKSAPKIIPLVVPTALRLISKPSTIVKTVAGAGVIAGGGLRVIPKVFSGTKKATKSALPVLLGEKEFTKDKTVDIGKMIGAGLGITALGVGAGKIVEKVLDKKEKVIETTEKQLAVIPEKQLVAEKPLGAESQPILPETQTITTGKKKYKKRKPKKAQSIRQSVRINIINKPIGLNIQSKRYITEKVLSLA